MADYERFVAGLQAGTDEMKDLLDAYNLGDTRNAPREEVKRRLETLRFYRDENEYVYDEMAEDLPADQKAEVERLMQAWNEAYEALESALNRKQTGGRRRRKTRRASRKTRKNRK